MNELYFVRDSSGLYLPCYNSETLPKGFCARFVRLAAKDLFGLDYPVVNAWDLQHDAVLIANLNGNRNLHEMSTFDLLEKGIVVGAYYPQSKANGRSDKQNIKVSYTHVLLFVGNDSLGNPVFIEQFKEKIQIRRLDDFDNDRLVAKVLIKA